MMNEPSSFRLEPGEVWNEFIAYGPSVYMDGTQPRRIPRDQPYRLLFFPFQPDESASQLIRGIKRTHASLHCMYSGSSLLPKVGDYHVLCDLTHNALGVCKTIRVQELPFNRITQETIKGEAMGDGSLAVWQKYYKERFSQILSAHSQHFSEDILVLFETFELLYAAKEARRYFSLSSQEDKAFEETPSNASRPPHFVSHTDFYCLCMPRETPRASYGTGALPADLTPLNPLSCVKLERLSERPELSDIDLILSGPETPFVQAAAIFSRNQAASFHPGPIGLAPLLRIDRNLWGASITQSELSDRSALRKRFFQSLMTYDQMNKVLVICDQRFIETCLSYYPEPFRLIHLSSKGLWSTEMIHAKKR